MKGFTEAFEKGETTRDSDTADKGTISRPIIYCEKKTDNKHRKGEREKKSKASENVMVCNRNYSATGLWTKMTHDCDDVTQASLSVRVGVFPLDLSQLKMHG